MCCNTNSESSLHDNMTNLTIETNIQEIFTCKDDVAFLDTVLLEFLHGGGVHYSFTDVSPTLDMLIKAGNCFSF